MRPEKFKALRAFVIRDCASSATGAQPRNNAIRSAALCASGSAWSTCLVSTSSEDTGERHSPPRALRTDMYPLRPLYTFSKVIVLLHLQWDMFHIHYREYFEEFAEERHLCALLRALECRLPPAEKHSQKYSLKYYI